jgi:diamine N-acetyltransferase
LSRTPAGSGVSLRAVDQENFLAVVDLAVEDSQRGFVSPNVFSIAQAWVEPTSEPLAIYAGDDLVGFAMYGLDEDTDDWWIIRFMIDRRHQRRGFGREAARALIRLIVERAGANTITLSYESDNVVAAALYRSLGFVETGEIEDGEVVARLTVPPASGAGD